MDGLDALTVALEHGHLDDVLELAHVARPVVGAELIEGGMRHAADAPPQPLPLVGDEMAHEQLDVLPSFAERRQVELHHLQAVKEVLAEGAPTDARSQIDVGRGDQAKVGPHETRAAEPPELALLEHAQQLGLRVERQVPDLVEKEGGAVGLLEDAGALGVCARERAALVTEELALDRTGRDRVAVTRDQLVPRTSAQSVQDSRDELLPGARLAGDQHRDIGGCDALDLIPESSHCRAATKEHTAGIDLDLDKFRAARRHDGWTTAALMDADDMAPSHTPCPAAADIPRV